MSDRGVSELDELIDVLEGPYGWKADLEALIAKAVREAKIEVIDYVLREPTGALIMTSKEMNATPDSEWRNQVIQYFFNTDSLRFNLERMKETLEKEALPSKTNGA